MPSRCGCSFRVSRRFSTDCDKSPPPAIIIFGVIDQAKCFLVYSASFKRTNLAYVALSMLTKYLHNTLLVYTSMLGEKIKSLPHGGWQLLFFQQKWQTCGHFFGLFLTRPLLLTVCQKKKTWWWAKKKKSTPRLSCFNPLRRILFRTSWCTAVQTVRYLYGSYMIVTW